MTKEKLAKINIKAGRHPECGLCPDCLRELVANPSGYVFVGYGLNEYYCGDCAKKRGVEIKKI